MADTGIDFRWIMEVTFVVTVLVGAPLIGLTSFLVDLEGWRGRVVYATTLAAAVWLVTAVVVYGYARYRVTGGSRADDGQ